MKTTDDGRLWALGGLGLVAGLGWAAGRRPAGSGVRLGNLFGGSKKDGCRGVLRASTICLDPKWPSGAPFQKAIFTFAPAQNVAAEDHSVRFLELRATEDETFSPDMYTEWNAGRAMNVIINDGDGSVSFDYNEEERHLSLATTKKILAALRGAIHVWCSTHGGDGGHWLPDRPSALALPGHLGDFQTKFQALVRKLRASGMDDDYVTRQVADELVRETGDGRWVTDLQGQVGWHVARVPPAGSAVRLGPLLRPDPIPNATWLVTREGRHGVKYRSALQVARGDDAKRGELAITIVEGPQDQLEEKIDHLVSPIAADLLWVVEKQRGRKISHLLTLFASPYDRASRLFILASMSRRTQVRDHATIALQEVGGILDPGALRQRRRELLGR